MIGWLAGFVACQDPAPVVAIHDTAPQARQLADHVHARWPPEGRALGWIETVAAFGNHRLHDVVPAGGYDEAPLAWLAAHLDEFPKDFVSSDSFAPSLSASILVHRGDNVELQPYLDAASAYLDAVPRTDEGAIVHWAVETPFVDTDEVWIDSLFMVGMVLLAEHDRTGDPAFIDAFVEQYQWFSDLCRDPDAQLYRHAYKDSTDRNIPEEPAFWARGNSWVLISAAELLARTDPASEAHATVAPLFEAHVRATLALQADDGLWHTVMNQPRGPDPDNYTETSAAALIGYALARGTRSVLDVAEIAPVVDRIAVGLQGRILDDDGDPLLVGTSVGTNPGDYDSYVAVPQLNDQLLGYGAAILFLAEIDGTSR